MKTHISSAFSRHVENLPRKYASQKFFGATALPCAPGVAHATAGGGAYTQN
jgi:hypothetical protein